MRIDKFLNSVNIVKKRSIAEEMCKEKVVYINSNVAKPSKNVKEGDIIEIKYLDKSEKYQVLKIPTTKTIPKSKKFEYVKQL